MSNQSTVNISDLSKAAVLAALFNASSAGGMGFLQAGYGPNVMTEEYAQQLVEAGNTATPDYGGISMLGRPDLYFDYLYGRCLKVDLTEDQFDPWGFDRDNGGPGTAQQVINRLRASGDVNPLESGKAHADLTEQRAAASPFEAEIGNAIFEVLEAKRGIEADGIPTPPAGLTARQHLDWASDQALAYYDLKEYGKCKALFAELVYEHPGTSWILENPLTPLLLEEGFSGGRGMLEYMMKGFAA